MSKSFSYNFSSTSSCINIMELIPRYKKSANELFALLKITGSAPVLAVCDENTAPFARDIFGQPFDSDKADKDGKNIRFLQLPAGEQNKNWLSIETIINTAQKAGIGRDGYFIGIGGGVICDLTAFAASVYMRGVCLSLIPTTLLCMADAALGGKTGINLDGIKNLAGTFYPAKNIIIVAEALNTLPRREWKNGIAELIKTAIIETDGSFLNELREFTKAVKMQAEENYAFSPQEFLPLIEKAIITKGRIVENDPEENTSNKGGRALLNLGHSFGHALETVFPLGHGEAVAWGTAKASELGLELDITPPDRTDLIKQILSAWGFETANRFLKKTNTENAGRKFREALQSDKKKKTGRLRFVVPGAAGAVLIEEDNRVTQFIDSLCKDFS